MKAPRFAYARPASVAEALALLAEHKDEARVLAGGQSLVPMLNFRVAAPKVLVDINRIVGLVGIKVARNHIRIGALTRHVELERSPDIARHLPLIAAAMPHIAQLPPKVPRLRTAGCAICGIAAAMSGRCRAISGERSSSTWRVSAPMRMWFPATLTPTRPTMRLMSTRTLGAATRKFSIGTRLWPPASTRASSLCSASSASASATLAGLA